MVHTTGKCVTVQLIPSSAMGQMIEFPVNDSCTPDHVAAVEGRGSAMLVVRARSRAVAEL